MIEITKPGKKSEPEKKAVLAFTFPKCGCEFRTDEYSIARGLNSGRIES